MTIRPPTRVYQNHHLDSTRWNGFKPRADDIVITTAYKAGTTWMQAIVSQLLFGSEPPAALPLMSPWVDMRLHPLDAMFEGLEAQSHRRFVKTHLPLDGLPMFSEVKYVYVGRHGPDVFMSLWNHFSNYTDEMRERLRNPDGLVGAIQPDCPPDLHELWQQWSGRGWFEWESDGYPFWSMLHHVKTWWEVRDADNVLFVHFGDLLSDLSSEMHRVAEFLEIDVTANQWDARVEAVGFDAMRRSAELYVPSAGRSFRGGAERFMFKGTNGRWRGVLSEAQLAVYRQRVAEQLSGPCARWLEHGGTTG